MYAPAEHTTEHKDIFLKQSNMLTLDKIYHAAFVLKDVIRRTELVPAPNVNKKGTVFLKPENLQLTGSFKVRGSSTRFLSYRKKKSQKA